MTPSPLLSLRRVPALAVLALALASPASPAAVTSPQAETPAPPQEVPAPESSERQSTATESWLEHATVDEVRFQQTPLDQVLATLSASARSVGGGAAPPLNFVLQDPAGRNPPVTLHLRGLPLSQVLRAALQSLGFEHVVEGQIVWVRPVPQAEARPSGMDLAFFPLGRAAIQRLGGAPSALGRPSATGAEESAPAARPATEEVQIIRRFLQSAGIPFDSVPGSGLAYDGTTVIATHEPAQLARIGRILGRYADARQVEIEARFLEVDESTLEELGLHWQVGARRLGRPLVDPDSGAPLLRPDGAPQYSGVLRAQTYDETGAVLRSLGAAHGGGEAGGGGAIVIPPAVDLPIPSSRPVIPGIADLGAHAAALLQSATSIGDFDVAAQLRALSRKQGANLLSAPRVTVISGNTATITVARELVYPGLWTPAQSQVSSGSREAAGSGGVAVTSATPTQFQTRNVGVELEVCPSLEDDGRSIALELHPRVTEFEGFVEYGGQNVAIQNGTVVRTPSGIYQPLFSTRSVRTRAVVEDGSTLVLGGLTREESQRVQDKVPLLGDLPLLGRIFRSQGEGARKRSLLIFVTASRVGPDRTSSTPPAEVRPAPFPQ